MLSIKRYLIIYVLSFCFICNAYALDLDKARAYFLSGDYAACINECERILAGAGHSKGVDELYYLLGLGYLKEGNFSRAEDIFNIVLKEFPKSAFKDEAALGLGDTYLLREQYAQAQKHYRQLLKYETCGNLSCRPHRRR